MIQCGEISIFFKKNIGKGCCQGDPLAAYIFICSQILLLMIKHNKSVKGISIGQIGYKLTQFADDTTVILHGSKPSLMTQH